MLNIKTVFQRLKTEYSTLIEDDYLRLKYNPIKQINDVVFVDGVSVRRESVLTATTLSGVRSVKKILVDDRDGTYEEVIQCGANLLENVGVTTFRCGLMTALCIDRLSTVLEGKIHGLKVGFIGCGRTNLQNCKAINEIFGISKVVIRGSERDRAKNKEAFERICETVIVDYTDEFRYINQCDVVVVCTSAYKKEDLISADKLSDPKLLIVLDCGYILDESFRTERISLTDHIEQISHYYESEFPFDSEKECYFAQMKEDNTGQYRGEKIAVYLHGIALGDAIVSEELIENGNRE